MSEDIKTTEQPTTSTTTPEPVATTNEEGTAALPKLVKLPSGMYVQEGFEVNKTPEYREVRDKLLSMQKSRESLSEELSSIREELTSLKSQAATESAVLQQLRKVLSPEDNLTPEEELKLMSSKLSNLDTEKTMLQNQLQLIQKGVTDPDMLGRLSKLPLEDAAVLAEKFLSVNTSVQTEQNRDVLSTDSTAEDDKKNADAVDPAQIVSMVTAQVLENLKKANNLTEASSSLPENPESEEASSKEVTQLVKKVMQVSELISTGRAKPKDMEFWNSDESMQVRNAFNI